MICSGAGFALTRRSITIKDTGRKSIRMPVQMPKCSVCSVEKESRAGLCPNAECKMSRPAAERESKKAKVKVETDERSLRSDDFVEKRFKKFLDEKFAPLYCPALKETIEGIIKEIKEEHGEEVRMQVSIRERELKRARVERDTAQEMVDLSKKKVSELKAEAKEVGASEEDINEALDADVPKDALIALILKDSEEY